jgi:CheY-like chemotaxis protein
MKVLVVDDDEDNMEVLALALVTFHGWDVRAVSSGTLALEICRSAELDAVLLDVEMPAMDGVRLLSELRSDPRTAGLPVIFVTACAEPGMTARLQSLGALAVLPKPFDPRRIGAHLTGLLNR